MGGKVVTLPLLTDVKWGEGEGSYGLNFCPFCMSWDPSQELPWSCNRSTKTWLWPTPGISTLQFTAAKSLPAAKEPWQRGLLLIKTCKVFGHWPFLPEAINASLRNAGSGQREICICLVLAQKPKLDVELSQHKAKSQSSSSQGKLLSIYWPPTPSTAKTLQISRPLQMWLLDREWNEDEDCALNWQHPATDL